MYCLATVVHQLSVANIVLTASPHSLPKLNAFGTFNPADNDGLQDHNNQVTVS